MKYKIVLVPFPFDDLSSSKVRPAICLTDEIPPFGHIVVAFITSKIAPGSAATDLIIDSGDADFAVSGLKVSSTIRLHRLVTISKSLIKRELGELSRNQRDAIKTRLRNLFQL